MTPSFSAFLLGLANARPQPEMGGPWGVCSLAPSLPGCHGWLHLSIKGCHSCQGPSPHSCTLIPLPFPPLPCPALDPGVVKASHSCCLLRAAPYRGSFLSPHLWKQSLLNVPPSMREPCLLLGPWLTNRPLRSPAQSCCCVTPNVQDLPPGHMVSQVHPHPLTSSSQSQSGKTSWRGSALNQVKGEISLHISQRSQGCQVKLNRIRSRNCRLKER